MPTLNNKMAIKIINNMSSTTITRMEIATTMAITKTMATTRMEIITETTTTMEVIMEMTMPTLNNKIMEITNSTITTMETKKNDEFPILYFNDNEMNQNLSGYVKY
jgi:hypothetical protein